jgi:hypothetical protein
VIDTRTHLVLAASVTRGPSQDAPRLVPALRQAVRRTPVDTALADAGYDSENHHATPRERLGVRSTVIALNWRGSRQGPATRYRRQMVRRFRKRPKGSRTARASPSMRTGRRWRVAVAGLGRIDGRPGRRGAPAVAAW